MTQRAWSRIPSRLLALLALFALSLLAAACGADDADSKTVVRVFAAASLTDAFEDLERAFEAEHAAFDIELNLAGSSSLRAQIASGAPADVFASANTSIMDEVAALGSTVGDVPIFATNRLMIAVPAGNPGGLTGIQDFARSDLFLGLCAETVPCGSLAESTLTAAAIEPSVDTREADVRSLLTKIAVGELDGGVVYATDVRSAGDEVEGIEIPAEFTSSAPYPIAVLDQGDAVAGGEAFVDFVLGQAGGEVLTDNGFGAP